MPRGPKGEKGRYSPAECIGARKDRIEGNPDMAHVSTSYTIARQLKKELIKRDGFHLPL